jgi:tetratricopeptide (TPR) repeat protein
MQSELENAKQAADQAKAQGTELAKRAAGLNSELEKTKAQRNELQSKMEQATSEITAAQSQLEDKQSSLEDMESKFEDAKQAADQAKAQGTELAKRAAGLNSELEKANAERYVVDPGNPRNQTNLTASYVKVGDFLMAQGNLVQALKWYRDGLAVGLAGADRLVKSDLENVVWQHNLSLYSRVGDVLMAQGNLADALKSYQDGLAAADRLAKLDPENAGWSRDVSIASKKIGEAIAASCPRTSQSSITVSRSWSRQVSLSPCP